MTLKHEAEATIREARRIVAMADTILDLAEREDRAPTILTRIDGYPAGGNGGGAASRNDAGQPASSTERATIAILDSSLPGARTADPVGELVVSGLWSLIGAGTSLARARVAFTHADQLSSLRKPRAHVAEVCQQEGCEDVAVAKGNCDPCRKWLERHPDSRAVPSMVVDRRNERRSGKGVHVDGPFAPALDPVVERLVDDFGEAS